MEEFLAGRGEGPLAPFAAGFVVDLVGRGYRPRSVNGQLELMAHFSRWLAAQGLEPAGLSGETAERFLAVRRERGASLRSSGLGTRSWSGRKAHGTEKGVGRLSKGAERWAGFKAKSNIDG